MRQANGTESETWGFGWGNVTQRNEIAAVYICSSGCIHGRRVYSARPVYTAAVYTATRACIHGHRVYSARPIYTAAVYIATRACIHGHRVYRHSEHFMQSYDVTVYYITLRYITPPKAPSFTPGPVSLPHKDSHGQAQHGFTPLANPNYVSPQLFDLFLQ